MLIFASSIIIVANNLHCNNKQYILYADKSLPHAPSCEIFPIDRIHKNMVENVYEKKK